MLQRALSGLSPAVSARIDQIERIGEALATGGHEAGADWEDEATRGEVTRAVGEDAGEGEEGEDAAAPYKVVALRPPSFMGPPTQAPIGGFEPPPLELPLPGAKRVAWSSKQPVKSALRTASSRKGTRTVSRTVTV